MYGKLFESMYDGTLLGHWEAIVTMQQLVILADREGVVDMTSAAIANRTSIPIDIIEKGLIFLESPDPGSRTPGEDGRRIVLLDEHRNWGWRIVNYEHYAGLHTKEERRAYEAERKRRYRERAREDVPDSPGQSRTVPDCPPMSRNGDGDPDVDVDLLCPDGQSRPNAKRSDPTPYGEIVEMFHVKLPELPRVAKLSDARRARVRNLWKGDLDSMEHWEILFSKVSQSDFLMGRAKDWRCDFDWITKPGNVLKIWEDTYA